MADTFTHSASAASDAAAAKMHSFTDQAADAAKAAAGQAQEAAEKAVEIGSNALDTVDEWLKPTGLSLKQNPVATLAIIVGVAAAAGALLKSRSQPTNVQRLTDEITRLARRAGL